MCDDYDTDFDSDEEGFERENLIDDIQKIRLALADSDVEEDEDEDDEEEEEEEDNINFIETSYFKLHRSDLTTNDTQRCGSQHQSTSPPEGCEAEPILTELVPMTTGVSRNEQESEENVSSQLVKNSSFPLSAEMSPKSGPSGCHGNLLEPCNNLSVLTIEQHKPETTSITSVNISTTNIEPNNTITHEQAIYNFASMQQNIAVQEEIDNDDNDLSIDDDVVLSSLDLRDTIALSLAHNQQYQSQILKELCGIEVALEDNKLKQMSLCQAKLTEEEEIQQALPSLYLFSSPYFRDADGHGPPANKDVKHLRSLIGTGAYQTKSKTWNAKEDKLLSEGVRMQNLKNKLSPLLISLKKAQNKLNVDPVEVSLINKKIKEVRELAPRALEQDLEGLDWDKLSTEYLPKRSAMECQLRWCHFGHPRVNRKPWTKQEDKKLLQLAKNKDHDEINWNDIAQAIQTNRTPLQCYQRFQRSLNKEILRSKWTPEEDEQLTELVKIFGEGNWQRIADYLEGRMGEQCMNRYMKACKPSRKGRWTTEENDNLLEAVRFVGKLNWERVAEFVPGRTGTQCRERYMNVLNPILKKGPWDKKEDQKLLDLVEKHGEGCWSLIAKDMVTRSDNQCWRRWNALRKDDSLRYRMNILRKKREMVSNFVGRSHEKPTLTPEDLDDQDIPVSRKEMDKKRKNKRIKTEPIERDTVDYQDKNQGNQSTSTSSCITIPVAKNNHQLAITGDDHVTATTGIMGNEEISPIARKVIKRRVSESSDSDEDWNECVEIIDTSELGTRTSARKRPNVNYSFADDFVSDLSQDEDEEEKVEKEKESNSPSKHVPGDRSDAKTPSISKASTTSYSISLAHVPTPPPVPEPPTHVSAPAPPTHVATPAPAPPTLVSTPAPAPPTLVSTPAPAPPTHVSTPAPAPAPALAPPIHVSTPAPAPAPPIHVSTPAPPIHVSTPAPAPPIQFSTTAPAPVPVPPQVLPSVPAPVPSPVPPSVPVPVKNQVQVEGSVASFSLLLQAFNINVSAVLQKVKPPPSQDAVQSSNSIANTTGQPSPLISTNTCVNESNSSHSLVAQSSHTDNSKSSNVCETLSTSSQRSSTVLLSKDNTGTQSLPETRAKNLEESSAKNLEDSTTKLNAGRETFRTSSPKKTGDKSARVTSCSPSKRKSTTPRRTRKFSEQQTQNLSDRIENIIQQNEKVLATNKMSRKPLIDHENDSQNELRRPATPSIPPLPPCLTTLKGFKTLMSIKGQLENLARKAHNNVTENIINSLPTTTVSRAIDSPSENPRSTTNVSTSSKSMRKSLSAVITPLTLTSSISTLSTRDTLSTVSTPMSNRTSTRTTSSTLDTTSTTDSSSVTSSFKQERNPRKYKSTSAGVAITPNAAIPSGSIERTSKGTHQSNLLASLPMADQGFSQDSFVKYFLYRKAPEYKLLASRFHSLFLWPTLLANVPLVGKVPKNLFKERSKQYSQNWGFPCMFALPVPSTPVSSSLSTSKPKSSARGTKSRKSSKKTKSSSSAKTSKLPISTTSTSDARSKNQEDNDTNKLTELNKMATRSERIHKRDLKRSNLTFGEDMEPRKKRKVIAVVLGKDKESKTVQESAVRGTSDGTATTQECQNIPCEPNKDKETTRKTDLPET